MPSTPLTEAELDRLENLLQSPPEGANPLWLDSLQGFLSGVVSAPRPVPRPVWLPVALGGERDWDAAPEAAELVSLVDRLQADVLACLSGGIEMPFLLYSATEGTDDFDVEPWVHGYLEGVALADPSWEDAADADTVDELLFPFLILAGGLDDDPEWKASLADSPAEEEELKSRCRESMPAAVQEAFDYWQDARNASEH